MANLGGKYGTIIREELRAAEVSYTGLEIAFSRAGVVDPKNGKAINRSRIWSYISDSSNTPEWFMEALGRVLHDDPDWWARRQADVARDHATKMKKRKMPLLRTSNGGSPGETVDVPALPAGGSLVGLLMEDNLSRPAFEDADLLILDVNAAKVTEMRVYAVREEDGRAIVPRKALWNEETDAMVLRAARGRRPDVDAATADVVGLVVVRYERFRVGLSPRGTFDLDGYLFGEAWDIA